MYEKKNMVNRYMMNKSSQYCVAPIQVKILKIYTYEYILLNIYFYLYPQFKYMNFIYSCSFILHLRYKYELSIDQLTVGLIAQLVGALHRYSQRSWVRFPFKPEFFQVSSFQPLRLKHLHCDDLHILLSLSAVQIYEFHIFMFIYSPSTV